MAKQTAEGASEKGYKNILYKVFTTFLIIALAMVVIFNILLIVDHTDMVENEAVVSALGYTSQDNGDYNERLNEIYLEYEELFQMPDDITNIDQYIRFLEQDLVEDTLATTLKYVINGIEYEFDGTVAEKESPLRKMNNNNVDGCSEIYYENSRRSVIFCYNFNNEVVDSVGLVFEVDALFAEIDLNVNLFSEKEILPQFSCINTNEGLVGYTFLDGGFTLGSSRNIYEYLRNESLDNQAVDSITYNGSQNRDYATVIRINNESYVVSITSNILSNGNIKYMEIYLLNDVVYWQLSFISKFVSSMFVLVVLIIAVLSIFVLEKRVVQRQLENIESLDPVLKCSTYKKFISDATILIKKYTNLNYAILYLEVKRFKYISEHYGESVANSILEFVSEILSKCMQPHDTYGHITFEQFVMLIHYKDNTNLLKKVNLINQLIANYPEMKKIDKNIRISVGVALVNTNKGAPVQSLINYAIIAYKTIADVSNNNIAMFDETIQKKYNYNSEIEEKMEYALKNKEFKVFYQPKYNIQKNKIDSAEALVRWYDSEHNIFISPGEYVPIFETNGFINKLDRYVFEEVCKFIRERLDQGDKMVPVSVNVSRVTATQPDFVEYYKTIKNQYRIKDGMITVEFTESFAYENYEIFEGIVKGIKINGMKCSIDDFGCGYSSFNMLKNLIVDEIKLDKFFLDKGVNKERDDELLMVMIKLANKLQIKVVQEGVETKEDYERLKRFGCEIIQGYYFSKPLNVSDFIDCINAPIPPHLIYQE